MTPVAADASASSGATSASESGSPVELIGPARTWVTISPANQNRAAPPSQRYPRATVPVYRVAPAHKATTAPAAASMARTLTAGPPWS